MTTKQVTVELCRSNSIGNRFSPPTVVEWWEVTPEDAARLVAERRPNGYFVRVAPDDATGN